MPLLNLGDEIGTLNDLTYLYDPAHADDSRWIHRPRFDWERAARRHLPATIEGRVFGPLSHMMRVRTSIPALAAGNDYTPIDVGNAHVYVAEIARGELVVVANFTGEPQHVNLPGDGPWHDTLSAQEVSTPALTIEAYGLLWLTPSREAQPADTS